MPVYHYKAVNEDGTTVEETYTASNKEQLILLLRSRKQIPAYIKESRKIFNYPVSMMFSKVKTSDISIFCRQFYTMYKAGTPIVTTLDTIRQQTPNKKFQLALTEVYEKLQEGVGLSEAFKRRPDVFPELLINMVDAGDASGMLDSIMLRMSLHYEKENKINAKVKGAMLYPAVLSVVTIAVVVFLLVFIMPQFLELFNQGDAKMPGITLAMMAISNFTIKYWYLVIGVIALVIVFFRGLIKSDGGKMYIDRMMLRLPFIKNVIKKIVSSRFTRTLSTLISSGIPLMQALEIVSRVVSNRVAAKGILEARDMVSRGIALSSPLKDIGIFPPMVISMVKIGEESGLLDDILNQTANYYDDEVEAAMQSLTTLIEPVMIVVMALVVGTIVVAMVLPMFGMLQAIDNIAS